MLWLLILLFSLCSVLSQTPSDGNFFSYLSYPLFSFSLSISLALIMIFFAGLYDLQQFLSGFGVPGSESGLVLVGQSPGPMVTLGMSQIWSLSQLTLGRQLSKLQPESSQQKSFSVQFHNEGVSRLSLVLTEEPGSLPPSRGSLVFAVTPQDQRPAAFFCFGPQSPADVLASACLTLYVPVRFPIHGNVKHVLGLGMPFW